MTSSSVDLVIVGAGAAGLAAARTARRLGLSIVVFEAMDRIGGRAFTSVEPFGEPWDEGCHWLHSANVNPFRLLAEEYGFRFRAESSSWRAFGPNGYATPAHIDAIDAFIDECLERATLAGVAGRDIPVWETVDGTSPYASIFRRDIEAEWSVAPERISAVDLARYRDSNLNWPVEDGYGALVAHHARGLPVALSTKVDRVRWDGTGVRVDTAAGTVEAAAVVVTASTSALHQGVIAFGPPLPLWKQEAFAAVPLGRANKVGVAIPANELGPEDDVSVLVETASGQAMSFQLRPFGRDFANAYIAGPLCDDLRAEGPGAMEAAAIDALVALLGSGIREHIRVAAATCWEGEPTILGAYAAALPGQAHRRAELVTPIADRIYFAGEATHPQYFTTCHGADMSGEAAVRALADRLRLTQASHDGTDVRRKAPA
jgi:monoamine oxidase